MNLSSTGTRVHVAIAAWAWPSLFEADARRAGVRLKIAKWKRPSPETIPSAAKASGLYMICTLAKDDAMADGFDDAMMLDYRGFVAEATGANIFFVRGGAIHTPIPDCILDGITRRTVMELARARGLEVIERRIQPDELSDFEECFLTGTAAEVTLVAAIGEVAFAGRDLGTTLYEDYMALVGAAK